MMHSTFAAIRAPLADRILGEGAFLGRLTRAIDLAELALAVGALLFSEATEEGSNSTVKWRK